MRKVREEKRKGEERGREKRSYSGPSVWNDDESGEKLFENGGR